MERKFAFNDAAEEYDKYRPSYPRQVFEDIVEYSGIRKDHNILEIGCGTGQATKGFVDVGYKNIDCIELGEKLAEIAAEKFKNEEGVKVYNSDFEEWQCDDKRYELAISATAFHWIKPEIGYPKVAQSLKENGVIAFFWTYQVPGDSEVFKEISESYKKYAPHLNYNNQLKVEELISKRIKLTNNSNLYEDLQVKRYEWVQKYSSDDYIALLNTNSAHRVLEESIKEKLFNDIKSIIEKHGGEIMKPQLVVSYLARKRR